MGPTVLADDPPKHRALLLCSPACWTCRSPFLGLVWLMPSRATLLLVSTPSNLHAWRIAMPSVVDCQTQTQQAKLLHAGQQDSWWH